MIKIIADENIPFVEKVFAPLGEVSCVSGRSLTAAMVAEADALLVRSITPVNRELLENSPVKFVGTATIGTDHIDLGYLTSRGISFSSAAGSNANSVVEYVLTALGVLAQRHQLTLKGKSLGIIGVGNIGSLLEKKAAALGLEVFPHDPPRQRQTGDARYVSLETALDCDIISCHVPLNKSGVDKTVHLLDDGKLSQLQPHQILINSSRGPVVDNQALKRCLQNKRLGPVVLDVWENEPNIDMELLHLVSLATPHIAGYSLDGKVNGTVILFHALCQYLGQSHSLQASDLLETPANHQLEVQDSEQGVLHQLATEIYPITRDDANLRKVEGEKDQDRGDYFDQLRKNYPIRRESQNYQLAASRLNLPPELVETVRQFGFTISPS